MSRNYLEVFNPMLTADLVDDLSDPVIRSNYSPPDLSSVGVIGHPPLHSPPYSRRSRPPPSLSTHYPSRPKTPGPGMDLTALIAQSRTQVGVIGEEMGINNLGLRSKTMDFVPRFQAHSVNGHTTGHRRLDSEPWPLRRVLPVPITTGNGGNESIPRSAPPLPRFQPLSEAAPMPISPPVLEVTKLDEINRHVSALGKLVGEVVMDMKSVEKMKHEVEMWKAEWGRVEQERKRLATIVEQTEVSENENTFDAILLDGDEYIYEDDLLRQGYQGGQQAAQMLLASLPNIPRQDTRARYTSGLHGFTTLYDDQAISRRVLIQVFINKADMISMLVKAGVVSAMTFEAFCHGLSSPNGLVSVSDVGSEAAVSHTKISEYIKLYAGIKQCQSIVVAAEPQSIPGLPEKQRAKLIHLSLDGHTSPESIGNRSHHIPNLFRTIRPAVPAPVQSFSAIVQSAAPPTPPKIDLRRVLGSPETESPTLTIIELGSSTGTSTSSNQGNRKKVKPGKKGKDGRKSPVGNRGSDKVDTASPAQSEDEDGWMMAQPRKSCGKTKDKKDKVRVSSVRNLKPRPCHTHYLSGWGCKSGEECDYSHEYELTESQLEELAKLAKEIICPYVKTNRCHFTDKECVYGHKCPRRAECTFGETCRFNDLAHAHDAD